MCEKKIVEVHNMNLKEIGKKAMLALILLTLIGFVTLGLSGNAVAEETEDLTKSGIGEGGLLAALALLSILLGILGIIVAVILIFVPIPLARVFALILGAIAGLALVAGIFILYVSGLF